MPDMAALRAKYFATDAELAPGESAHPYQSAGNTAETLVDGFAYFGALRAEVNALKTPGGTGKFFYFTSWLLTLIADAGGTVTAGSGVTAWDGAVVEPTAPFKLDDGSGATVPDFIDELAEMAANGVDVRVLVWVSPMVLAYEAAAARVGYIYSNNALGARSVHALRQKPGLAKKACLNTLAHPLASIHAKMTVCGDANGGRGYVSGIDFDNSRTDGTAHSQPHGGWHDVTVRVAGPAAAGCYATFRQMWNELISIRAERFRIGGLKLDNYVEGTPAVPGSPPFEDTGGGTASVQVLRTVPRMNFALGSTDRAPIGCIKRLVSGFRRDPWTFAPDGIFAFAASLERAIGNAETYIYVEDQGFWGQPIMDWLRLRLAARPALRLIMVFAADPQDGPEAIRNLAAAINGHLGKAGANMDGQVAFYARDDHVVNHAKTWIIDGEYLIAGSANAFRRSLYTDGEVSLGVIDENDTDTNAAIAYRRQLWGEHCGLLTEADRAPLTDLQAALAIWDPGWGGGAAAPAALKPSFVRKRVPFEVGPGADQWPALDTNLPELTYDQIDADSRLEY
jgi:phosphatidylserine/phosphatidylglycerophosphate/cardiolipin synthase-like enzyme